MKKSALSALVILAFIAIASSAGSITFSRSPAGQAAMCAAPSSLVSSLVGKVPVLGPWLKSSGEPINIILHENQSLPGIPVVSGTLAKAGSQDHYAGEIIIKTLPRLL